MLKDLVSISDARQCTYRMHKSRPTTMLDSCPHHVTAIIKTVDVLHAVWSITLPSSSTDTCVSISLKTQFSTWYMAMSPSAGIIADAPLSDIGSKRYVALVFYGTFTTPSANYQLSGQRFCVVQGFVSLWLLLLWFDFEDDTPSCIDLERRRLLCDHLTLVLNRSHKAEMVCLKTTKCLPTTYSSVVRAFAHGAMDRRIDPSWRTH